VGQLSDRFEIHYTPKHASWLNEAETAIGMHSGQGLQDGRVGDGASSKPGLAKAWAISIELCGKTLLPEY